MGEARDKMYTLQVDSLFAAFVGLFRLVSAVLSDSRMSCLSFMVTWSGEVCGRDRCLRMILIVC